MIDNINRRRLLQTVGTSITIGTAGCIGTSTENNDNTENNNGKDNGTSKSLGKSSSITIAYADDEKLGNPKYPTGVKPFANKIEKKSDGDIAVKVYPNGQQGSQSKLVQKVQTGSLQMCRVSYNNLSPFVPLVGVKNIPLLIQSAEQGNQMLKSNTWTDLVFPKIRKKNFEPLMQWTFGFRTLGVAPGTVNGGVRTPHDIKNVKIRVSGSDIVRKLFKKVNANPVNVAWGESYSAMNEGVFDAIHISLQAHANQNFDEIEAAISDTNLSNSMYLTTMNKKFFDNLDQTYQDIIHEAAKEVEEETVKKVDNSKQLALEDIKKSQAKYVKLSKNDRDKWSEQVGADNKIWNAKLSELNVSRKKLQELKKAARS